MGLLHLNVPGRKSLKEVLEKDWERVEKAFSSSVRRRGEDYFSSGKVIPTDIMENTAFFRSSGQFATSYSITVAYDQDTLIGTCTCPADPPCKHIYASLLLLKRKGRPGVREVLMRLHKEELVEVLLDYLPDDVRIALTWGPQRALLEAQKGDVFPLIEVLPFVPATYDPFESLAFLKRAMKVLWESEVPCPHTFSLAFRSVVRRAEDKVRTLLRIHEMLTSYECDLPLNFGDLLTEEERRRAYEEGVPYDLIKVAGETPPKRLAFSSAEACMDYLLNTPLPEEEAREMARECIDRFGLFPPLVLFYLQVGGEPEISLKLLSNKPKASLLLALKDLVSDETFSRLKSILKSLSPEEYALYVAESSPKDLFSLKGEVDEDFLTDLILKNAGRIGEPVLPLVKEEVMRIASGRRWRLYPRAIELLKVMREISPREYERTVKYIRENFRGKRRLMEMLEEELGD